MNPKSFLFVGSWIQPLKTLPLKQRWNVMEAIVEYSISGKVPESPDAMEALAFGFIRNEIDRMRYYRKEAYRKRLAAANDLQDNEQPTDMQTETETAHEVSDAKACKAKHTDAPYDIESVSKSVSKSVSDKKSSSSGVRVCVKGGAITTILDTAKMNERIQHGIRIRPRALSGYDYLTLALMGGYG